MVQNARLRIAGGEFPVDSCDVEMMRAPIPLCVDRRSGCMSYEPSIPECRAYVHYRTESLDPVVAVRDAASIQVPGGMCFDGFSVTGWEANRSESGDYWNVAVTLTYGGQGLSTWQPAPADRLRSIIASRTAPAFIGRQMRTDLTIDEREKRARQTLRMIIGEQRYRRFLKDGFVTVKAKSGMVYQVQPAGGMTNVYDQGKYIERLCVVLDGRFPPTDSLIMRYLMLANDEELFRAKAVKWPTTRSPRRVQAIESRSLVDVWQEIKPVEAAA